MVDRGVYPDPDYGLNNLAIPEIAEQAGLLVSRASSRAPKRSGRRLTLTFDGINYKAAVWLNGQSLGEINGAFIRGIFDVTESETGRQTNVLAVRFRRRRIPGFRRSSRSRAGRGERRSDVSRRATFVATEGWDWIPGIRDRDTGIWQPVTLTATGR